MFSLSVFLTSEPRVETRCDPSRFVPETLRVLANSSSELGSDEGGELELVGMSKKNSLWMALELGGVCERHGRPGCGDECNAEKASRQSSTKMQ